MGKIFGGSAPKPPKMPEMPEIKPPPPGQHEIELGRQAMQRHALYESRYAPLEDRTVASVDRPTERLISSRASADAMQEATAQATQAIGGSSITGGLTSLRDLTGALSRAGGQSSTAGLVGSRALRDERALASVETGLGMSDTQVTGMTELATQQNRQNLSEFETTARLQMARRAAEQAGRHTQDRFRAERNANLASLAGSIGGVATGMYQDAQLVSRLDALTRRPALTDFRNYG